MKRLSVVIMAHPQRAEYIPYLKEKLGDVPVIWDRENNLWDTCRRAWLAHDMTCEYGLVVQDDAIVCDNFYERVEPLITGDFIYQLYAGERMGSFIERSLARGRKSVIQPRMYNEVALCMQTRHIKELIAYADIRDPKNDRIIQTFARRKQLLFNTPIPSLIDHREGPSIYREVSNLPRPNQRRRAYMFYE